MKFFNVITILFACTMFCAISCGDSTTDSNTDASTDYTAESPTENTTLEDPSAFTPPLTSSDGSQTQHYICPDSCEGSGGSGAGNCPVCGKAYVHNSAFHSNKSGTDNLNLTTNPATDPGANPFTTPGDQGLTITPPTPGLQTTAEPPPAQNEAGVFHYTCSKGCAGGSGSAGTCAGCGGALSHNSAYHNK